MKLTNKENIELMGNLERVKAVAELKERKEEVEKIAKLSTETILITMPQAVKNLQRAYENLVMIETKIENEIIQKRK
jgi:hypothetical protein